MRSDESGLCLLRFLVDDHRQGINGSLIVPNDLPYGAENFICTRFRQVGLAQLGAEHFGIERLFLGRKFRKLSRQAQFLCSAAEGWASWPAAPPLALSSSFCNP